MLMTSKIRQMVKETLNFVEFNISFVNNDYIYCNLTINCTFFGENVDKMMVYPYSIHYMKQDKNICRK